MTHRARFKLNGGNPVMLCSKCSTIIKYWRFFTEEEKLACTGEIKIPAQYCDDCEEKLGKIKISE